MKARIQFVRRPPRIEEFVTASRMLAHAQILSREERGREGGSPSSGVPIQRSCGSSSQTESFPELQRKAGTRLLRKLVATTDFRRAEYLYGAVVRLCE